MSQVCPKSVPCEIAESILHKSKSGIDISELMKLAGHTNRTRFRLQVIRPLIDAGLLELTIPDKPQSSKQKYITTEKGLAYING